MISVAKPNIGDEEFRRVQEVMNDGMLADGPEVRAFEEEFAAYCDADAGVATTNGTTALHSALIALGIGSGCRVVTTPFSFIATANAIRFTGAEPVFVDIDEETYNLDPQAVEDLLRQGEKIDALLPVHLYGLPADMEYLADLAEDYDLAIIEDAAQAHGATYEGRSVGSYADVACFSFYPTKNMTTGEGGMIITDDQIVADRASQFINHGRRDTYKHDQIGHNFRMTSIAAAIGRVQLEKLPAYITQRRANARQYSRLFEDADIVTPYEPVNRSHVYHQYTIQCEDRDGLRTYLANNGIDSGVYYPAPIHHQPAYGYIDVTAPNAELAARSVLSLPVHPSVTGTEIQRIATIVNEFTTRIHEYSR